MFNPPFAKQRIWLGVKFTLMRCDLSDKGIQRGLPDRLSGNKCVVRQSGIQKLQQ